MRGRTRRSSWSNATSPIRSRSGTGAAFRCSPRRARQKHEIYDRLFTALPDSTVDEVVKADPKVMPAVDDLGGSTPRCRIWLEGSAILA
jgi:hypothetical protein